MKLTKAEQDYKKEISAWLKEQDLRIEDNNLVIELNTKMSKNLLAMVKLCEIQNIGLKKRVRATKKTYTNWWKNKKEAEDGTTSK